jgi:hypothetical protein
MNSMIMLYYSLPFRLKIKCRSALKTPFGLSILTFCILLLETSIQWHPLQHFYLSLPKFDNEYLINIQRTKMIPMKISLKRITKDRFSVIIKPGQASKKSSYNCLLFLCPPRLVIKEFHRPALNSMGNISSINNKLHVIIKEALIRFKKSFIFNLEVKHKKDSV